MKGAKRFAAAESLPDTNDTALRNKRILAGSSFDVYRAESSQQPSTDIPPLDPKRAESSRQHVRALNTQFASWIQAQLKNHPDELWEDGTRDYLAHASDIMDKFSDVVRWLKANAVKGGSAAASLTIEKKTEPEIKNNDNKLFHGKTGIISPATNTSFSTSWSSGALSNNQSSGGLFSSSQSPNLLPSSQNSGLFSNSQSTGFFSKDQTSGLFSNSQSSEVPSANQSSGLFSSSQGFGASITNHSSGLFSNSQSTGLFSNNQSTGLFSNNQSTGAFSNSATPILFGAQNTASTNHNTSDVADDENELERPSSPSVKKSEETGIVVVHEVKCKLYIKSSDPADKDTWKDKGTGQLSIKCKEGISKGTKDSKPTIVVRNDVGKVLLNALLYPGIKTNAQKNSLVAIFHIAGDDGVVAARTFLIRTKTMEDRSKLETAIQEYAPAS
ncbi:nucleoporin NUP116/NSP116 [Euphorbia lathyris]|uniref:nucleoporin NUP116/NSP116 n=1 Tax=Euphorbia lathyris TaxID=212925 RepID=UPI0033143B24